MFFFKTEQRISRIEKQLVRLLRCISYDAGIFEKPDGSKWVQNELYEKERIEYIKEWENDSSRHCR
jgi:hypothetical protein